MDRVCLHYECPYRNSLGYCSVTACCNYKVSNKVTESTTSYSPTVVFKPVTNADRIRAMTDEELANAISDNIDCACCNQFLKDKKDCSGGGCPKAWFCWLKAEVKE